MQDPGVSVWPLPLAAAQKVMEVWLDTCRPQCRSLWRKCTPVLEYGLTHKERTYVQGLALL